MEENDNVVTFEEFEKARRERDNKVVPLKQADVIPVKRAEQANLTKQADSRIAAAFRKYGSHEGAQHRKKGLKNVD